MNNHKFNIFYDIVVPDEANEFGDGWKYLVKKMKEHGTEQSLYAADFVFAKRLSYTVQNNKTALYVEIFGERVKNQWEQVFASFIDAMGNDISVVSKRTIPVSQDALSTGVTVDGQETTYGYATRIELADRLGVTELGHTQL